MSEELETSNIFSGTESKVFDETVNDQSINVTNSNSTANSSDIESDKLTTESYKLTTEPLETFNSTIESPIINENIPLNDTSDASNVTPTSINSTATNNSTDIILTSDDEISNEVPSDDDQPKEKLAETEDSEDFSGEHHALVGDSAGFIKLNLPLFFTTLAVIGILKTLAN